MKNLIICLIFIIACKENDVKVNTISDIQEASIADTVKNNINNKELREISLPYCFKIDTLPKSNFYQTNLDTFLIHHNLKKNNLLKENKKFHKKTEDFISEKQGNFMHYPYEGNAYAINKLKINNKITAIFYAYLFDSEMIQPRIEIQTFDSNQKNIDNLIVSSTFSSECSGYRDFCINSMKTITINDYYYCNDIHAQYKNQYKYKINDTGKFVHTE